MPRAYPPLSPAEVIKILKTRGFSFARSRGSHHAYTGVWNGQVRVVTVDTGMREFGDPDLIRDMIVQSGMTREDFYGAIPRTARKINLRMK